MVQEVLALLSFSFLKVPLSSHTFRSVLLLPLISGRLLCLEQSNYFHLLNVVLSP